MLSLSSGFSSVIGVVLIIAPLLFFVVNQSHYAETTPSDSLYS